MTSTKAGSNRQFSARAQIGFVGDMLFKEWQHESAVLASATAINSKERVSKVGTTGLLPFKIEYS